MELEDLVSKEVKFEGKTLKIMTVPALDEVEGDDGVYSAFAQEQKWTEVDGGHEPINFGQEYEVFWSDIEDWRNPIAIKVYR